MPIYRRCTQCGTKVPINTKCSCELEREKQRYKEYAKHRQDKDIQKIYTSTRWEKVKTVCKIKQNGICLYSYYILGEIKQIELYHHIVETKEDISKAYDVENVIGVTDVVHKIIHSTYNKSNKDKKAMQELLLSLKNRYSCEMR